MIESLLQPHTALDRDNQKITPKYIVISFLNSIRPSNSLVLLEHDFRHHFRSDVFEQRKKKNGNANVIAQAGKERD